MVQSGPGRPGFIASYVGAFHRPVPHRLPLAVVAPPDGSGKVVAELNAIPGRPLHASAVPSTEAGTSELLRRNVYGVLFVDIRATSHRLIEACASGESAATAMTEVMQLAEAQVHRSFCVDDIRPPLPGDRNSLTSFYLVIGLYGLVGLALVYGVLLRIGHQMVHLPDASRRRDVATSKPGGDRGARGPPAEGPTPKGRGSAPGTLPGEGIGGRRPDAGERVAVDVMERLVAVGDLQDPLLLVGPGPVGMGDHVHPVAEGPEGLVEEGVGQDAVDLGADGRPHLELGCVRLCRAAGQEHLAAWNAQGQGHRAGRRLPVPHLIVEGLRLTRLDDVGVVPEPVQELGAVGLTVDGLELVALDERVAFGPVGGRVLVVPPGPLPDAGHGGERSEPRQGV